MNVMSALRACAVLLLAVALPASAGTQHLLDVRELAHLRNPMRNGAKTRVAQVPLLDGTKRTLELEHFDVFTPDAQIVVHGQNRQVLRKLPRPSVSYFRGEVAGEAGSLVFLSVSEGRVEGFVVSEGRRFSIASRAPTRGRGIHDLEIVVAESTEADEIPADGETFVCALEDAHLRTTNDLRVTADGFDSAVAEGGTLATPTSRWLLNLAIETDYELYTKSGSSAANVNTFVGNLVAAASTIYRRDLQTELAIAYVGIYTSSADPFNVVPGQSGTWNGSTVTYSASHALAELGDRWANAGTRPYNGSRSSVVMVSGKPQTSGVAWVDTVCQQPFACSGGNCGPVFDGHYGGAFAYCGGVTPPADLSVPNPDASPSYTAPSSNYWPLLQFTHELGHNVGSGHTHCITLSSADQTRYGRQYVDNCYAGQGGCFSGGVSVPVEKGTIMSYCHLQSGGGTNTRFTFGQSNEASYVVPENLRARVAGKTPALSAINTPASVVQGSAATASVTATGASTYLWSIANGTIGSGQGTASITFTGTANPVTLYLTATNAAGCSVADTTSVPVTVSGCVAPTITTQPAGATITAGASATLSVAADGTAPLAYQWYRGASSNTADPVSGQTGASLSATPATTTSYWVRVSNACGAVNSNAATVTVTTPTAYNDALMDFNGDGKSEVIWRHANGQFAMWEMNGRTIVNGAVFNTMTDANWKILGFGDFDGDGDDDIFFRNAATGNTAMWLMQGRTIVANATVVSVPDLQWQMHAIGDFNADGRDELIWRHLGSGAVAMWEMNGLTLLNGAVFYTVGDLQWQIQLAADFTGDGRDELLWRHATTGQVAMWNLNGRTLLDGAVFYTLSDNNWQIVSHGDYNNDDRQDILWRNAASGAIAMWEMNGRTILNGGVLLTPDAGWQVERSGDFHGDDKDEILWRNTSTGAVAMWEMNGHTLLNGGVFHVVGDLNWKMQPRGQSRPALDSP